MKNLLIKSLLPLLLFFIGGAFVAVQAMPPMFIEEGKSTGAKTTEKQKEREDSIEEQDRRITDSDDDDLSSEEERGIIIEAKEEVKSDDELSYTALADSSEAVLAEKIQEIRNAQQKWEEISSLQITKDLLPANRDDLLEQVIKHVKAWKQQKENEDPLKSPEALLLEYDKLLEQLSKIQKRLIESTDPLKGSVKKLSLDEGFLTPLKPAIQAKKQFLVSDTEDESSSSDEERSSSDDSSDASPDSSDEEFGAKTFMRKIRDYVRDVEEKPYAITKTTKENTSPTITEEQIREEQIEANLGKYYVANFSGEYLDYFKNNRERREAVAVAIDGTLAGNPPFYRSEALRNLEKKYLKKSYQKVTKKFEALNSPKLLKDPKFIKGYVTTRWSSKKIDEISPKYGSPIISTSKDEEITPHYSDHPKKDWEKAKPSKLYPKYSDESKKPKHRLIGLTAVIIHEANEYLKRIKADVEKLRTDKEIGASGVRDWNNQEIIFNKEIQSKNVAGYVPLIYPNLSKMKKVKGKTAYSTKEKKLFGLNFLDKDAQPTRLAAAYDEGVNKKTMGDTTKENSLYVLHRILQWKLAEKYLKDKSPDGELIWIDHHGKFRRFLVNEQLEKKAKKTTEKKERAVRKLDAEFKDATSAVGSKPVSVELPAPSQHVALTQQVEAKLKRIGNPEEYYSDDDMKGLGEILLSPHAHYIDPAIASVPNQLEQAISNGFINDPTKQQAIIALHLENHFVGIYLHRTTDGQVSIIYFDPAVSKQGQQPLHNLSVDVATILAQKFPNVPVTSVASEIQTYAIEGSGTTTLNVLDNNHCGPFVLCVMTEMSKGNVRLNPNGTRKLQIKFSDGSWKDLPKLSQKQSNDFGKAIRKYHLALLASDNGAVDNQQIDILRSLIPMPLETMSVLESVLPKVSLKKVLKK